MSETARDRAQNAQRAASDPAVSAFVAASAGSGKTKLLTDRLLRLMLTGAAPGRIQCLTYTKAAAAEMSLRLQKLLGEWVTLDDKALDRRLADLDVSPNAALRAKARALFAEVLDLPGGMRIGTIHAFCQSLLRRFPLEAALSPHFRLVDELEARAALEAAQETMLEGAHTRERRTALAALAGLATAGQFGALVHALVPHGKRLTGDRDALARVLGVAARSDAEVIEGAVFWQSEGALRRAAQMVAAQGAPTAQERARAILEFLSIPGEERAEHWGIWRELFLRPDGVARGPTVFVNKKLGDAHPGLLDVFLAEQARVAGVEDDRRAVQIGDVSAALALLARPVVDLYAAAKETNGQLDYDDLIGRTASLLVDPGAAWVLYKLDGGLDHLLLDEVQDTAPAQWRIAGALTAEFFAGLGAREVSAAPPRSVFAVGDRKQSIYGFQGADPDQFEFWRGRMRREVEASGAAWRDVTLDVSFRSTAPVLALVDAVFAQAPAAAGVSEGAELRHVPDRAGVAGRVELWPLVPAAAVPEAAPWAVLERNEGAQGAAETLAEGIATWIAARVGQERLESQGRMLAAGDILVLVRRRNTFARALVRALKDRKVAVAGLDRMVLTDQPAVADLLALCDALLLPEDDLSFAAVLTSPLGGLGDDDLIELAPYRTGSLWAELRRRARERPAWQAAHDVFAALLARVDYAAPHALLVEVLGPLGGRAKLFARLGQEAAEPVDELLSAALDYAATHPPSLQGFVHWLRRSGAEVKREAEGAGGFVRVMTVHGAKGLQAPVVILPDTTGLPPDEQRILWADDPAGGEPVALWSPRKELRSAAVDALRNRAAAKRMEEYNRLLYVALTRAEDRLVVCGWETKNKRKPTCWYDLVQAGFTALGATGHPFDGGWPGEVLVHECDQSVPPKSAALAAAPLSAALPGWAGAAPGWAPGAVPAEPAMPSPLAPSRPEHGELGAVPAATSPLAARDATGQRFRRGQLIHALLQHLPVLPRDAWAAAAQRFLARPGHGLDPADIGRVTGEVLAVLDDPLLAPLFSPAGRAEVPLTGLVNGQVVGGVVDRLAVFEDRVLIADYKTNRAPPAAVGRVPVLYLRQMAAYRAVLRAAFPGRAVECVLVWTSHAHAMPLPSALLDRHAPGAEAAA
ncbi:MAG: double-strand break repair helicase AddA [Alphaproteobacteria bacterium]|nr:double-strand break repair helicase AddA [Alphaproteobacteria bacterium]